MSECCGHDNEQLAKLRESHGTTLKIVLMINLAMFFVEMVAGLKAQSTALVADSLDMLGDSFVYGISFYALKKSRTWNAKISLLKGVLMGAFGCWVLGQAVYRFLTPVLPVYEVMGVIGTLALLANLTCALMLLKHRNDDINMRSTWLCTRNDVFANLGVLAAAALVGWTGTRYPDLIVGGSVAAMILYSALSVIRESIGVLAVKQK